MTNTTKVEVLEVKTDKSQKNVKSLKQQIKELKLEIENLEEGTAEYNAKLVELGNALHTAQEIQENAKIASQDYGDTLSSITKVSTGLVASISAVNGVMNLMGASSDEAQQAMLKVQSLMAIVQGLSALDDAEKNFNGLWLKIKNLTSARKEEILTEKEQTIETQKNTAANESNALSINKQKTALSGASKASTLFIGGIKKLGSALKSFALANPFTLIVTAITTAITLVSKFIAKAKEARIEARNTLNDNLQKLVDNNANDTQQNTFAYAENAKAYNDELNKLFKSQKEIEEHEKRLTEKQINRIKKDIEYYNEIIEKKQKDLDIEQTKLDTYTEEQKQQEPYLSEYEDYLKKRIQLYKEQYAIEQKNAKLLKSELLLYKEGSDDYNNILEKLEQANKSLNTIVQENVKNVYLSIDNLDKQRQANEDKTAEERKQANEKYYQDQINKIKDNLAKEQALNKLNYSKNLINEEQYLKKELELQTKYQNQLIALYKKNPLFKEIDKINAEQSKVEANKTLVQFQANLIRERAILAEQSGIAVIDEKKRLEEQIEDLEVITTNYNNKRLELLKQSGFAIYNEMLLQNEREEQLAIENLDKLINIEKNKLNEQLEVLKANSDRDTAIENETFQRELEALEKEKSVMNKIEYDKKIEDLERVHKQTLLQIQKDYDLAVLDIDLQRTELEQQYSAERLAIAENEVNKKIALQESYFSAYQSIQSNVGGLLNEIQSRYDENSKQYKNIQRYNIIADTISGAMSAFSSAFKSGLPFPINTIVASALSGLVTAQGVAQLANLKANRIGNISDTASNIGTSTNTYETLAYSTLSNIEGNIRDSRVIILESDISDVQRRVHTAESENIF